ncbi:helix-turn-helix domain-containing protein [Lysinibacillus sp. NPDC093692]|uniref:helix-turn-helix domain-containing protein n=1 Tax=Lysinibacillus sp. NPDC093692 TaxID=3390578 RepID=UPI003D0637F1
MYTFQLKSYEHTKLSIALKGYTIRGFSRYVGISHSFLSQILNGKRKPSAVVAKKIADGLDVRIEDIFLVEVVDESTVMGGAEC